MHTGYIYSSPECLKSQKVAFLFLRQCLCGTSSSCWSSCMLAVICTPCHQMSDIYVFVLQRLQHVQHCPYIRATAAKCHINNHCKQMIGGCKHFTSLVCNWLKWLLLFSNIWSPCNSCKFYTLQYIFLYSFHTYIDIQYLCLLGLYLAFGSAKTGWHWP